ncbi:MAG: ATP-binding protein [Caldilineaceae bacterium]
MIRTALASTSGLIQDRKIALHVTLPDHVPTVYVDQDRITQVLLNLLSNAIKFSNPDAGQITVALRQHNGHLEVSVRDNGPGLSRQEQTIIFDKFRQVTDTSAGKPQGTGLGLPISMQIISHYGGKIWVESAPGEGAVFRFTLPTTTG